MATLEERLIALAGTASPAPGRTVEEQLRFLSDELRAGAIDQTAFVAAAAQVLGRGYLRAYSQGSARVRFTPGDVGAVERLVQAQVAPLRSFAADLEAGREPIPTEQRVRLYADSTHRVQQAGSMAAIAATGGRVRWVLGDSDDSTCEPCRSAASSGPYPVAALPGLPGWPFCAGGNNCRCELVPA